MNRQENLNQQEAEQQEARRKALEKLLEVKCKEIAPPEIFVMTGRMMDLGVVDELIDRISKRAWEEEVYDEAMELFSSDEEITIDLLKRKWQEFAESLKARFKRFASWLDGDAYIRYSVFRFDIQENPHRIEFVLAATFSPIDRTISGTVTAVLEFNIALKENL